MVKNSYKKVILGIVLFILFLVWNLILIPSNLDEIWNYGFSHNIYSGLIPYKDFNMIITPMYPFLMSLGFHLFGSSMLVFHIEQAIILTILSFILFSLLDKRAWIIISLMFFPVSISFPSYNMFLYFLLVLLIYLEKNKSNDYLIGVVLSLAVLTKHSVGLCLLLPSLYYVKDLKKIEKRFLGFIGPVLIFVIYLLLTKSMSSFIDLCILGLFDFASTNGKSFNIYFYLTFIFTFITGYFIYKDKRNITNYYVLAFYSMAVPLFDLYHVYMIFLAFMILVLSKIKKDFVKPTFFGITLIIFEIIFMAFFTFKGKVVYPNKINHFEYRYLNYDLITFTNKVNNFLEENKDGEVVILDPNSYYFRLINDMKITYLDLLNTGNFGYDGSNKLLTMIKNKSDAIFLVNKDELSTDKQFDKRAINYVISHGEKIGNIDFLDVYVFDVEK